ncbi:MAG: alpha/beta hydrolase family protein [Acholeplasmataceae bacterium]
MERDLFLDFDYLIGLKANKKNTRFAYLVGRADVEKNTYHFSLHAYDGRNKKLIKIKENREFVFETEDTLLFPYARNKAEEKLKDDQYIQYYRYDIENKRLSPAYRFPFLASVVDVIDDRTLLLAAELKESDHILYQGDDRTRKERVESIKREKHYEAFTGIPFYHNGQGFAGKKSQLFLYEVDTKRITPIAKPSFDIENYRRKDDRIYYVGQVRNGVSTVTPDIYYYDISKRTTVLLYGKREYAISQLYFIGDRPIVTATDMKEYGLNENRHFYTVANGDLELFKSYDLSIGNSIGSDARLGMSRLYIEEDDRLLFVSTVDDHSEILSLDRNGALETVFEFKGSIDGLVRMDGDYYAVGLYQQYPQEIYQLDIEKSRVRLVTRFNRRKLKDEYVAKPKPIAFKSDGHRIKGFALYPKDFDSDRKYRTILNIHGGPKTVYGTVYYHEMQYWASLGYIVLFANPRGSDGKGNAFADIRGKYGTIDYQDLMRFLDRAIERIPAIDQEQLYVTGGSYGGFMTNRIVTDTDRFRAAATQRSIANWLSFHGTSDIGYYFSKDQTAGHPLDDFERLWEYSPLSRARRVETPLLFIHADEDYRCPIEQAMQFFTVLKEKGLDTKFVWFKGENHELSRSGKPQARSLRLKEITTWFETHQKQDRSDRR